MSDQTADWDGHAQNARTVRRDFWAKAKRVGARLPFAEDLLAAYFCAFDRATPRHVPARIVQVADIPRTKNGKVVELAVKAVVHGMPVGNTDALANPEALELFRDLPELQS